MKLVVFSDLHLDAPFAWLGGGGGAARRRRQALRDALRNVMRLAREVRADAVLCAGDLFEHERAPDDTGAFLQRTFADLHPVPVFIAPGNHDWYGPRSLYRRTDWSPNVHLFTEAALRPVELDDGLTLWGAAHTAPAGTRGFLDGFRVERGGVNLALFHGSLQAEFAPLEDGKAPHAPFRVEQIEEAGLAHAFLGHYHRPSASAFHTYPGNPDPLTFGEDGERGAVVAAVGATGLVDRQVVPVHATRVHDLDLDLTGCESRQDVRDRLRDHLQGLAGIARVTLCGELSPSVDLRPGELASVPTDLDGLVVRVGNVRSAYDLAAIAAEPTVRGQFVRDVRAAADLSDADRRRVLATGLRALEGRDDLEVL